MNDSILENTRKHGLTMRKLALQHSLQMAKLYRDYDENPIGNLIKHLEETLVREELEHNRFDEAHRDTCNYCHDAYKGFLQEDHE